MKNERNSKAPCPSGSCGSGPATAMATKLQDQMIASALAQIRHKLLIMSGKGGVGKSSIAANLAVVLARRGYEVGLMDVDLHGPSIARIMGIEGLLEVTSDRFAIPKGFNEHLKVVSMQSLLPKADDAVIWRGPAKTGVIRQFLADVQWGRLDFLVIDAPPGTGDEPLSVAQTIPDARALIVTTPQEVALSDVRKSINFCRTVGMDIVGLVENMGPFACPCCGETIELFKSGGGRITADRMQIAFLGSLPFDAKVVTASDRGLPLTRQAGRDGFAKAMDEVAATLVAALNQQQ